MPLFYKPLQTSMPSRDGNRKWHPRLVKVGKMITTQKIGEIIAEKSSLTPGDVHNVIRNLMTVMREQLLNSRSVQLDGLGTFTMKASASGMGVDTADEVAPSQITHLRIQFTPTGTRAAGTGGTTRAMFTGVEYERWMAAKSSGTGGDDDGDDGENDDDPTA